MEAGRPLNQADPKPRGARGFILVVALLLMVFLSMLGMTFMAVSATESTIASNEVKAATAFNIAEAGLERAKRTLTMSTASSLNVYLSGNNPGPYLFGSTPGAGNSLAGGNYIVRIYNNNDGGGPTNDTDNTVFIESTGSYRNAQKQIVALVQVPLIPTPPGSLSIFNPSTGTPPQVELEKGASIDGNDWIPPADISSCLSIATCGTLTANPAIAGASTNSATSQVQVQAPSTMLGSPSSQVNNGLSFTQWNNLVNMLVSRATRTLTVPNQVLTGNYTWGTPTAPEITVISATEVALQSPGVINGAGVLIIDNNSQFDVKSGGILNWQGIVINRGKGLEMQVGDDSEKVRIFGATIMDTTQIGSSVQLEMENAQTFLKYSSSALDMVRNMLSVTVRSWQEVGL